MLFKSFFLLFFAFVGSFSSGVLTACCCSAGFLTAEMWLPCHQSVIPMESSLWQGEEMLHSMAKAIAKGKEKPTEVLGRETGI